MKKNLDPLESEYSYAEVRESLARETARAEVMKILNRENELRLQGIPDEEIKRVMLFEFGGQENLVHDTWRPDPAEIGAGIVTPYTDKIPASAYPPKDTRVDRPFEPYLTEPYPTSGLELKPQHDQQNKNYLATGSVFDSQPSMHNEEGHIGSLTIPPWTYDIEDSQFEEATIVDTGMPQRLEKHNEKYHNPDGPPHAIVKSLDPPVNVNIIIPEEIKEAEQDLMQYVYQGHDQDDICAGFNGKTFDLNNRTGRPIPPSEGLGYTNTHPNCQCYWNPVTKGFTADSPTSKEKEHLHSVNRKVAQRARHGKLHTVRPDGGLSQKSRRSNPIHEIQRYALIREALIDLKQEFKWLTKKYQNAVRGLPVDGKWYVVRAATRTITDHRSEGEKYRRLLDGDELHAIARTAIGKGTDINHNPDWKTQGHIYDSEYDLNRKEIQMLVHESDQDIIDAIENKVITAVSINGGSPRTEEVSCDDTECFNVPRGVVLGELDNIGFTWVVTDPRGLVYKGKRIASAEPGIKNTVIQSL